MFSYVLFDCSDRRHRFWAKNDRAAKGKARRFLGRVHSTYYLGDSWDGMRPVAAWNLGSKVGCETAALYCEGPVDAT